MQDLNRVSTAGTSYPPSAVLAEFVKSTKQERWFIDLLDSALRWQADLSPFVDWSNPPVISYDATAAVKRTLSLQLVRNPPLTTLSDLIRPRYQLRMPDGGFIDFSLGVFALGIPERKISRALTRRVVACADISQLLVDDTFAGSFSVQTGAAYRVAIQNIVNGYAGPTVFAVNVDDSGKTLAGGLMWETSVSRLRAINDLLQAITFLPLWVDEVGALRASAIPDYTNSLPSYTFDTRNGGPISAEIPERVDPSLAFNTQWVKVEDARRAAFFGYYQNNLDASPVSSVNWRPVTGPVVLDSSIPDKVTANQRAKAIVQEAARIYSRFTVSTFGWPFSQDRDIYELIYSNPDESTVRATYIEMAWRYTCKAGALTDHDFVRVVAA